MMRNVAIGIGCKSDASAEAILRVVGTALDRLAQDYEPFSSSSRAQRSEPGPTNHGLWVALSQDLLAMTARSVEDVMTRCDVKPWLFSHERKAHHVGLNQAASALGLQLRCFPEAELAMVEGRLFSRSARVADLTGVGSVAEAAALCGAGERAGIVVAKFSADGVSCAVAASEPS